MNTNSRKVRTKLAIKWVIFSVIIILAFIFSTTGNNHFAKPLLLIPIVVCISIDENELISGIIGAVCGLLIDMSCGRLLGFNAILIMVCAVSSCLCFRHLMRKNFLNAMALTAIIAIIQGVFDLLFYYVMWNTQGYMIVLNKITIPSVIFTVISSLIIYFLFKKIVSLFAEREIVVLEDNRYTADKK